MTAKGGVVREQRLEDFTGAGYDKGRPVALQALWFACSNLIVQKWWCPARLRVLLLRAFGAKIGTGVFIRHRVKVLWPWKLEVGDHSWLGEGVWILNLEPVTLGRRVCVSQEAFLCAGSHNWTSATFEYRNAPITLGDASWVAARSTVLPGVRIGPGAVVTAGCTVGRDVPTNAVVTRQMENSVHGRKGER
ncbi:MAG: WcaF family extracellular polysaccharide biosynthesis acetyltransferase [Mycobacteriales bacterium]|nr:WcaF family extracellular polysaccharide biosynthesis acetyltransferase [Mycobacteriales bacterium]